MHLSAFNAKTYSYYNRHSPPFVSQVVRNLILANFLIHGLQGGNDNVRQRSLINHVQVGLQLRRARSPNEDRVAVLAAQKAVVRRPPKRRGMAADSVRLGHLQRLFRGRHDGGLQVET